MPLNTAISIPKQKEQIEWVAMVPFWSVQIAAVAGVVALGWSWSGLALALASYYVRMFGVSAGYHRYLSHRSFKTSRAFQFVLAVLATTSAQKGPLWWAAHHRAHHKHSDMPEDVHSAKLRGFWWAHVGWILVRRYVPTEMDRVKDLAKYPELRWLNRWHLLPPVAFAVGLYLTLGLWGLLWGFFVSTTLLWHGTFTVNSVSHLFGKRRYATTDESRNSFLMALFVTCGEGWHNNHHYYQRSERQGFYWWEVDTTHYALKVMSWLGLVWDLHEPPKHVRDAREARVDGDAIEGVPLVGAPEPSPALDARGA
jgi:stearoyl-CoA desaturase (delta-9 desaturase)